MNSEIEKLMEQALKQAEAIRENSERYEKARCALELIEDTGKVTYYAKTWEGQSIQLMELPDTKRQAVVEELKRQYQSEIDEAYEEVKRITNPKRKAAQINEDFDTAINDMVKSGAENVKTVAEAADKIAEAMENASAPAEVAPVQPKKRVSSKEIISDSELKRMYFKERMTIVRIAEMSGASKDALYKRIEDMKADLSKTAKECACSG